ncbi:hypothetical protein [Mammaliicoccus stepanovicii]|uniref:FAD-binding domain-containing protein n=1 Tax=Mammaliicoccus stepanovicii TaxID=643214 RepID=A0A239ZRY6_9STAP|nr:hypothetical protein [Mammaliicoccus stepanovicii]GGI38799.1 hypothetical protein GCM10010896_00190 [Mammaliicoccus stepanovicii]SNV73865.1 Uncharacterised protein [Mammaliicoccus stepanovicii]
MKKSNVNHISIIGGGPGGLMLGLLLQQQSIPFTIYEHSFENIHADSGGSLDILQNHKRI